MPEVIVTQRTLIRVIDEAAGPAEATPLNVLESDALVRIINEITKYVETESTTDIAWLYMQNATVNVPEAVFRVLGIPVPEGVVQVVNETAVNINETLNKVLGVPEITDLVKLVTEVVSIKEAFAISRALVQVRTERQQVDEVIVKTVANVVVKVIDEVVNVVEGTLGVVAAVTVELVKVVSEVVKIVETQIPPAKGLVKIINDTVGIGEVELGLSFVIGQLVGLFRTSPRLQAIFRINQDTEQ